MSRQDQKPWERLVPHAWAWLVMPWPRHLPSRVLRGAVIEAVGELGCDIEDWSNHSEDGQCIARQPRVLYRIGLAGPEVHLMGERTAEHVETLRRIETVRLPDGQRIPVEAVRARAETFTAAHLKERHERYELVTPYFPCDAVHRRRPKNSDPEETAFWASQAIESSIREWFTQWGAPPEKNVPIHVHTCPGTRRRRVTWSRPDRGELVERKGIAGEFITNMLLPDGIGIGSKVSEGFGEIRRLRRVDVAEVAANGSVRRRTCR